MADEPSNGELGRSINAVGLNVDRLRADLTKDLDNIVARLDTLVPRREHDLEVGQLRQRIDSLEEARRWRIAQVVLPLLAIAVAIWLGIRGPQ